MAKKRQSNEQPRLTRKAFFGGLDDKHHEARLSLGKVFCLLTFFNDSYFIIFGGSRNPATKVYCKTAVVSIAENNSDQDEVLEIMDDYLRTFKRDFHPDGRDFTFGVAVDSLTKELKEVFNHPMIDRSIMAECFLIDPFSGTIAVINYSGEYEIIPLGHINKQDRPLFIIGAYNPNFKKALIKSINDIFVKLGSKIDLEKLKNEFKTVATRLKINTFGISMIKAN